MNQIEVFNHNEFGSVRIVDINGEPWLVGRDVAAALGYKNVKDAIASHVDADDKRIIQRSENTTFEIPNRGMTLINESGLYSLALSSKLPTAKQFRRWVTSNVLPSIRKHGAYIEPQTLEQMIASPEFGIRLLTELQSEREKSARLQAKVDADAPKVLFADAVETSPTSVSIKTLATILKQNGYDIGQNRLYQKLRDEGYLISRRGDTYNLPTQQSMNMGLFEVKEGVVYTPANTAQIIKTTRVTGKGQLYFVKKFCGHLSNRNNMNK